jgi:hypothetical protein
MYFEIELLPGVQHFSCERLNATLSTASCVERYQRAAEAESADLRYRRCRSCPIGARHAGARPPNESPLFGLTICARCHRGATRLIGKHLCVSCYNRQREQRVGKNSKGNAPVKLLPLARRTVTWLASGEVKTRTIERSLDIDELIVAVLRDETHTLKFIPTIPERYRALRQIAEGA